VLGASWTGEDADTLRLALHLAEEPRQPVAGAHVAAIVREELCIDQSIGPIEHQELNALRTPFAQPTIYATLSASALQNLSEVDAWG